MRSTYDDRHDDLHLPRHSGRARRAGVGESARKGALAGLMGGAAMMMDVKVEQKALVPEGERTDPPPK